MGEVREIFLILEARHGRKNHCFNGSGWRIGAASRSSWCSQPLVSHNNKYLWTVFSCADFLNNWLKIGLQLDGPGCCSSLFACPWSFMTNDVYLQSLLTILITSYFFMGSLWHKRKLINGIRQRKARSGSLSVTRITSRSPFTVSPPDFMFTHVFFPSCQTDNESYYSIFFFNPDQMNWAAGVKVAQHFTYV